ncbi:hypothetical protein AFM11_14535 [Mycolicibacterium wolinskyi]|uniref:Chitin-binding protein n=1 Tax=Mycolicibacterium wolinskyi TaxID=59750 RepID=A0A132PMG6_9MYCO|nr:hypothetical protein [Mycolicibacterium wolinskyi]KWX23493.1 hypothetical protein AFM11_14535 [Mycolicibacterium wolinskyi]
MNIKQAVCASAIVAGVGLAGAMGTGIGTASADPCNRPPNPSFCNGPGGPAPNNPPGPRGGPGAGPGQRGLEDGRIDHQPFIYNGQNVNPVFDHDRNAWGFWFLGVWIPL